MKIGQYDYRYGQAVAILVDHVVRFGNVEKVITQSTKDGESTAIQVAIEKPNAQNDDVTNEPERFLVARDELIERLSKPEDLYGDFKTMVQQSEEYQRAIKFQERVDNPVRVVPEVQPAPAVDTAGMTPDVDPTTGGDRDSSSPSPDEGADDVPL